MQYKVIKSRRRTLSLEVAGDSVVVRAPVLVPNFVIERFVRDKSRWIEKHLRKIDSDSALPKDKIMIGGKIVDLVFDPSIKVSKLEEQKLIITSTLDAPRYREVKIRQYLQHLTQAKVDLYISKYADQFGNNFKYKVRAYKSRWGSCSPRNELTFNLKLAMVADEVVEYVVVHELCHTRVRDHSKNFWEQVLKFIPDYKNRRKWLRDNHHYLEYENR